MRQLTLFAAALLLAGTPVAPAHADENTVVASYGVVYQPVGSGYLVSFECNALARAATGSVAKRTTIFCSLNGVPATRTMPGAVAVVSGILTTVFPLTVCTSAKAKFLPAATATDPEYCEVLVV